MASLASAQKDRAVNAVTARCNSGFLRLYSGGVPANADAALAGNTLLAELLFGSTAFGNSSGGSASANAITQDSDANATGTATFFRAFESDGTTVVFQGTVGTSGAELNLSSVSINTGDIVDVTAFTYTQG